MLQILKEWDEYYSLRILHNGQGYTATSFTTTLGTFSLQGNLYMDSLVHFTCIQSVLLKNRIHGATEMHNMVVCATLDLKYVVLVRTC